MRFAAPVAFCLFALACTAGPPDDATISRWIRDLGDDDVAKRDEAEKGLAESGELPYERMKAILAKGECSPEANARLTRLVGAIDHERWWEKTWKEKPIDLANDYVKDKRCLTCGQDKVPYNVVALEHAALAKRFPDIRFFALDWQCCQDHPEPTLILVVGKTVDVRFEIGNSDPAWPARLALHIPAVTTAEDARETASLLVSVTDEPDDFDVAITIDPKRGKAESKDTGFVVKVPYPQNDSCWEEVRFDKDGKLKEVAFVQR